MQGQDFLSNEPVEGDLLANRLAQGAMPAEEALRIAIEIGVILKQAHARGQVHGNLSPFAIAITAAGARVLQPPVRPDERAAPYRAPEQVEGRETDWRVDIFSYGALLFELAAGKRAFEGAGAELDRAILQKQPRLMNGKSAIHAAMEGVIAECLEKDPARRRQRAQNAMIELKLAGRSMARAAEMRKGQAPRAVAGIPISVPGRPSGHPRRWWPAMVLTLIGLLIAAAAAGFTLAHLHPRPEPLALDLPVPPPARTVYPGTPVISPDGRYLVLSAEGADGKRMLWMRPLDQETPTVISGTEGGSSPFWSPDSRWVAFFGDGSLKKVPVEGGPAVTVCGAESKAGGGTWNANGTILFARGLNGGLERVAAGGGRPQPALNLVAAKSEESFLWPQFLPDGKHFVFFVQTNLVETSGVYAGVLDSQDHSQLFPSESNAVYAACNPDSSNLGCLLFIRDRALMVQRFDAAHLLVEGSPSEFLAGVGVVRSLALAPVSISGNGVLVYQKVDEPLRQMVWMDRTGKRLAVAGEPGQYGPPRISADGSRAIVGKLGPDGKNANLWILTLTGAATLFPTDAGHVGSPIWSPAGWRAAFFGNQAGHYDLYAKVPDGKSKTELLLKNSDRKYPTDWSRDGKYILFDVRNPDGTRSDVWAFSVKEKRAAPIMDTIYNEGAAAFSPDGKWVAYASDETPPTQVYVQPFLGLTNVNQRRWQVSKGGTPRWRGDGGELYCMTREGNLIAVKVHSENGELVFDVPRVLFQTRPVPPTWNFFDVTPDGQRFLLNLPLEWSKESPITVLTNWTARLGR